MKSQEITGNHRKSQEITGNHRKFQEIHEFREMTTDQSHNPNGEYCSSLHQLMFEFEANQREVPRGDACLDRPNAYTSHTRGNA